AYSQIHQSSGELPIFGRRSLRSSGHSISFRLRFHDGLFPGAKRLLHLCLSLRGIFRASRQVPKSNAIKRTYSLTWPEEIVGALVFLGSFLNRVTSDTGALQRVTSCLPIARLLGDQPWHGRSCAVANKIRLSQFAPAPRQGQRGTLPAGQTVQRSRA